MAREFIIYADESDRSGTYYSNFYGGALVRSEHVSKIIECLDDRKQTLGFYHEVKWSKVSSQYLDKYGSLIDLFFDKIRQDKIKVRIMFTQNRNVPIGLTREQVEDGYFRLYYQFIKHAFGLKYASCAEDVPRGVRIYFDKLPDTKEKIWQFRSHICGLNKTSEFRKGGLFIRQDQIAEVRSHDHVILQCLDIVLGAMQFRLNDKHKQKPETARCRGKKTIAKEKLYKHINSRIRELYPNFNIGISTGSETSRDFWEHSYRHWCFTPKNHRVDDSRTKP